MSDPTAQHLLATIAAHARGPRSDEAALRWWTGPPRRVRQGRQHTAQATGQDGQDGQGVPGEQRVPGRQGEQGPPADRVREEVTYGELWRRVESTATALRHGGMRPADRVLFSVRPRPAGVVLALAVVRLGAVIVFVDPGSTPELFAARVAVADPRWAMTESVLYALSRGPLRGLARSRGLLLPDYASLPLRHVRSGPWLPGVPRGALSARSLASSPVPGRASPRGRGRPEPLSDVGIPPVADLALDAEALVVFTSGTTSDPRAVVHSAGSLGAGSALLGGAFELAPGDVVHTDQMLLGIPALLAGGTWSVPPGTPAQDVVTFARHAAGQAGTYLVPADLTLLLDAVERGDACAQGPRVGLVGGAPVTRALLARARRVLPGTRWTGVYGMTEILPVAVVEADDKLGHTGDGDLVGRPLPGIEAWVDTSVVAGGAVEPDGEVRAPGARAPGALATDAPTPEALGVGELVLRGPSLMTGYLAHLDGGRPPVTEHRTGDLARLDELGRIVLVGRTRDMIIRGTVNIYPGLFEPHLAALPGVGEAALVGVQQEDGDEKVVLVVTSARAGTQESGPASAQESGPVSGPASAPASGAVGQGGPGGAEPDLTADHPLLHSLRAALPDVLDHGALPDVVLHVDRMPLAGRSRKPDRAALSRAAARHLARDQPVAP